MSTVPDYDSDDFMLLLVVIAIGIGNIAFRAWAATMAWEWHVVPLGAPSLPLMVAFVAFMFVGGGSSSSSEGKTTPPDRIVQVLAQSVVIAITLGLAWMLAPGAP